MPSVGMRRTTRVFGVVKGADVARVLRSGRRLWPESGEAKTRRGNYGDDWLKLVKTTTGKGYGGGGGGGVVKTKQEVSVVNNQKHVDGEIAKPVGGDDSLSEGNRIDRRWGLVYARKRKRLDDESSDFSRKRSRNDKMFGLQFSRRQRWKKGYGRCLLAVVVQPSSSSSCWVSCFLFLVLSYAKRVRLTLKEISSFVLSEPIYGAYESCGIRFVKGPPPTDIGICQFYGVSESTPLFSVDFSAVPLCFKYLHSAILLSTMFESFFLVNKLTSVHSDEEEEIDWPDFEGEQEITCNSSERKRSEIGTGIPNVIETNGGLSVPTSVRSSRLAGRNGQHRNVLNSRGIQRRRSSLRRRKARNPSLASVHKTNGAVASDHKDGRKSSTPLSGVGSSRKLRSLVNRSSTGSFKGAGSAMVDSGEGLDSSSCSANILIIEADKCYRVKGAIITLEMSASREWHLIVKKDDLTRCTLKAEKVMRPCSSNRFNAVIMFSLDNGWKLEFANRQDWFVFKDLYKECSDRNVPAPVTKSIPVPGVREVPDYADSNSVPFHRPETYISANGNDVSRALARRTANYDMDSEDEEWLSKFNNEFQVHLSDQVHLSEDNFELMIDALEKAYYSNPDDISDENSAASICRDLGNKEVVEAVYGYWTKKRKQKRSPLLRVFQGHQPKRAALIPKPLLRKKRSFKRRPGQLGKGKQPIMLQAMAAQHLALEEKNAMRKIEEAKTSANRSMELASLKRKRAQLLMENADMATYKATMIMRIAEAARAAESTDAIADFFLN